jgi:hypothetical protein
MATAQEQENVVRGLIGYLLEFTPEIYYSIYQVEQTPEGLTWKYVSSDDDYEDEMVLFLLGLTQTTVKKLVGPITRRRWPGYVVTCAALEDVGCIVTIREIAPTRSILLCYVVGHYLGQEDDNMLLPIRRNNRVGDFEKLERTVAEWKAGKKTGGEL